MARPGDPVAAPLALPPVARAWRLRPPPEGWQTLVDALDVPPLVARLLARRGVTSVAAGDRWLRGGLRDLPDPFGMTDMAAAADRVAAAVRSGESICVHGDYDVDGTTGTALLVRFLRDAGGRVAWFAPHRVRDGYGVAAASVRQLADDGVRLLVTVDTGIAAHEGLAEARARGIDVVVCDHHTVPDELPPAVALLDPKRDGDGNPYEELAAVGVAFLLVLAVRARLRDLGHWADGEPDVRPLLDLVALGTVADLAPLRGINRLLVPAGLRVLAARRRPGLAALLAASGIGPDEPVDAGHLGFKLGPAINAAGRLGESAWAVELLLADEVGPARARAEELVGINQRRRQIERDTFDAALRQAAALTDLAQRRGLVLWSDDWHPGVVGIVASRIAAHLHRPTLVVAVRDGVGTGSGRGIHGVDLLPAIARCGSLLLRWGGHRAAAGLTVLAEHLPALAEAFAGAAWAGSDEDAWAPTLAVDEELSLVDATWATWQALQGLAPFGIGNPEPSFLLRDVRATGARSLARGGLRLRLGDGDHQLDAVGFGLDVSPDTLPPRIDAVGHLVENRFGGRRSLELRLRALRPPGGE